MVDGQKNCRGAKNVQGVPKKWQAKKQKKGRQEKWEFTRAWLMAPNEPEGPQNFCQRGAPMVNVTPLIFAEHIQLMVAFILTELYDSFLSTD